MLSVSRDPQIQGILCIVGAWTLIAFQDAAIKWLSGDYPLHEIVFFRSTLAFLIIIVFVYFEGGFAILKTQFWRVHLLRGLLLVISNMSYFLALAVMSVAEAISIFFIAPVFITALSAIFLGEHVGVRRWGAVFLGLIGTLVMLRPGSEVFSFVALLPVLAAATYAIMQILTRKIGVRDKASTMVFYVQLTFIFISGLFGLLAGDGHLADSQHPSVQFLFRAWVFPGHGDLLLLLMIGGLISVIGYLMAQAYRLASAASIAPFEYINIPVSLVLSFIIWGDWPDGVTFVGIALIVSGGLIIMKRKSSGNLKGSL